MTVPFHQLAIGARFEFRGRRYYKVALSMAHDENRCANVFREETSVVPDLGSPRVPVPPFTRRTRHAPTPAR